MSNSSQNKRSLLPNQILRMLKFFDICGFNSGLTKLTQNKKSIWIIYSVHISLAVFFTLFKCYFILIYYPSLGVVEKTSKFCEYMVALCSYWLIIFDSISNWREHRKFWDIFQQIHEYYSSQHNFTPRIYMFKMIEFFSMTTFLIIMGLITDDLELFAVVCSYLILVKLSQFRIFYYLFCVEILYHQLKSIEKQIEDMMILDSISRCEISKRLKFIRGYFHCIHELSNQLNQIFGWSQVAVILFCFQIFLSDFNDIYFHWIHFGDASTEHGFSKYGVLLSFLALC